MVNSYYAEHVNKIGDFKIQVSIENTRIDYQKYRIDVRENNATLLKARIHS